MPLSREVVCLAFSLSNMGRPGGIPRSPFIALRDAARGRIAGHPIAIARLADAADAA